MPDFFAYCSTKLHDHRRALALFTNCPYLSRSHRMTQTMQEPFSTSRQSDKHSLRGPLKFVVILICQSAIAQSPVISLDGRVVDEQTLQPLPNVNVYLAGTTRGTSTDLDGKFSLANIPPGMYDLVVSMVGYGRQIYRVKLFEQSAQPFDARLKETPITTAHVEVTARDPVEWRASLEHFSHLLFGKTEFGRQCRILNPEVIDFQWNRESNRFEATAREPLRIVNLSLGYNLTFVLQTFLEEGLVLRYGGAAHFAPLNPGNDSQRSEWGRNRRRAYQGSLRHFFLALIADSLNQSGFRVSQMQRIPGSHERVVREPVKRNDIFRDGQFPFEKTLEFDRFLCVEFTGESPEPGFANFWSAQVGRSQNVDLFHQISWLQLDFSDVRMNIEGHVYDPYSFRTYGYWSYERLGEWLPLDYRPD